MTLKIIGYGSLMSATGRSACARRSDPVAIQAIDVAPVKLLGVMRGLSHMDPSSHLTMDVSRDGTHHPVSYTLNHRTGAGLGAIAFHLPAGDDHLITLSKREGFPEHAMRRLLANAASRALTLPLYLSLLDGSSDIGSTLFRAALEDETHSYLDIASVPYLFWPLSTGKDATPDALIAARGDSKQPLLPPEQAFGRTPDLDAQILYLCECLLGNLTPAVDLTDLIIDPSSVAGRLTHMKLEHLRPQERDLLKMEQSL